LIVIVYLTYLITQAPWVEATAIEFFETQPIHRDCPRKCYEDTSSCRLGPDWTYKAYNVMWVEWEQGIAYRKATGRVLQDYWDRGDPEEIEVRLG
jgi:hypothetical protein